MNNAQNILVYTRYDKNKTDWLTVVHNFKEQYYAEYWLPVPKAKAYVEVLNSDNLKYGGGGAVNHEVIHARTDLADPRTVHVKIKIPPLTVMFLKPCAD